MEENENEEDGDTDNDEEVEKKLNNLNCHTGVRFADYTESEQVIMLIDIIKEKYKFVHPVDYNPNKLSAERFITCKQLVDGYNSEPQGLPEHVKTDMPVTEHKLICY